MRRIQIGLLLLILLLGFCQPRSGESETPLNIILMIGDGMGMAYMSALQTVRPDNHLRRFPVGGMVLTHPYRGYITDSAASATAMATGEKTRTGRISVDSRGRRPLQTILEAAEKKNMATGLVATCRLTHATPAAFAAHVPKRSMESEIAVQMAAMEIEVLLGGGLGFFLPAGQEGSRREDDADPLSVMKSRHPVVSSIEELRALSGTRGVYGFFDLSHLPPRKERSFGLEELTRTALDILSAHERGFFLMVEGSQIDWGGHDNDMDYILHEMIEFDEAVGAAMDFAEKHGNTLLVVTSDHETGGLSLLNGNTEQRVITQTAFASGGHTGEMVPLLAAGPHSGRFGGIHENTNIGKMLKELVGR